MSIAHHPDPATLMSHASGALGEALGAVVAEHLELCPACRRDLRRLEMLGGALLGALPVGAETTIASPAQPARQPAIRSHESVPPARPGGQALPAVVRRLTGAGHAGDIAWRTLAPGVRHVRLPLSPGSSGQLRLLRIAPGRHIPEHGHGGAELTLVMHGSFSDLAGVYGPGDVADLDEGIAHTPVAGDEAECICLVATEKSVRFTGLLGAVLRPFGH